MNVMPVIERELRAQSRLAFTYHARVVGALAVMVACAWFALSHQLGHGMGGELFVRLNGTLFFSIWILAPLLCSDSISRERREGTVGLLFLTPLKALDVVLAKGLVHGLRALSVLLAVLPVIIIALLMGGVGWMDALLSVMMNLSALCWAMAAGLLASSLNKTWLRSQLLAFALVACFGFLFILTVGGNLTIFGGQPSWWAFPLPQNLDQTLEMGYYLATDYDGAWGMIASRVPTGKMGLWALSEFRVVVFSVVFLLFILQLAAWNLRRFWREEPASARRVWLEKKLFTPVLMVSFLRRWMRRKLEKNPIGWLETRTWSGRLVTWGWFAVLLSIYSAAFNNTDVSHSLEPLQRFMGWLLLGIIAVSAAGSFQRERESGVLELLLVSPMSVGQILGGRLRGLWGQFLPAFLLLLGIWVFLSALFPGPPRVLDMIVFFCGAFLTLPVIGLYYSLRRGNFIGAFLFTLFWGLAVPYGLKLIVNVGAEFLIGISAFDLPGLADHLSDDSLSTLLLYALIRLAWSPIFATLVQVVIAIVLGRRLYIDMERRNFAFSRGGT